MKILDDNKIFKFNNKIILFNRFKIIINKEYLIFFIIIYEDLIKNLISINLIKKKQRYLIIRLDIRDSIISI